MALSRVFKAGNSQAVRIPQALAYDSNITDVEVERHGDTLVIRPRTITMADLMEQLAAQPTPVTPRDRPALDWPNRARTMTESDEG
jgi:antitoxin VapB